jgi:hypothetical protein
MHLLRLISASTFLITAQCMSLPTQHNATQEYETHAIRKRENIPKIGDNLPENQKDRVREGFADVYEMLKDSQRDKYSDVRQTIFSKYYDSFDFDKVNEALKKFFGQGEGADEMKNIDLDYRDIQKKYAIFPDADMKSKYPTITLTPTILDLPVFSEVDFEASCDELRSEGLSQERAYSMSSALIREIMHWSWLFEPVMGEPIDDVPGAFDFAAARAMVKSKAPLNAESYACYITELF